MYRAQGAKNANPSLYIYWCTDYTRIKNQEEEEEGKNEHTPYASMQSHLKFHKAINLLGKLINPWLYVLKQKTMVTLLVLFRYGLMCFPFGLLWLLGF